MGFNKMGQGLFARDCPNFVSQLFQVLIVRKISIGSTVLPHSMRPELPLPPLLSHLKMSVRLKMMTKLKQNIEAFFASLPFSVEM
jgi:hypothetical protein